jgi:hypothetical protein
LTVDERHASQLERRRDDREVDDSAARLMERVVGRRRNEESVSRAGDCIDGAVWSDPIADGFGSIL